ncbi:hypothetical protein A4G20_00810 [Pasteurellaceae bacterium RH1A]|nr:hypothetical protein A4G20_00810 [Pasteurellaceae bacterium RH1A]
MKKTTLLTLSATALLAANVVQADTRLAQLEAEALQKAQQVAAAEAEYQKALNAVRMEKVKSSGTVSTPVVAAPAPQGKGYTMPDGKVVYVNSQASQPVFTQAPSTPVVAQAAPTIQASVGYDRGSQGEKTIALCRNGTQEQVTEGVQPCRTSGVATLQVTKHYHAD